DRDDVAVWFGRSILLVLRSEFVERLPPLFGGRDYASPPAEPHPPEPRPVLVVVVDDDLDGWVRSDVLDAPERGRSLRLLIDRPVEPDLVGIRRDEREDERHHVRAAVSADRRHPTDPGRRHTSDRLVPRHSR